MKHLSVFLTFLILVSAGKLSAQVTSPDQPRPQAGEQGWVQVPSNTTVPFAGVTYASASVVFVVAFDVGQGWRLMKSIDGGQNWFILPGAPGGSMHFFTEEEGVAGTSKHFFRTDDGGLSWDTLTREQSGNSDLARPSRMRFLTPDFGYAAGLSSIMRTLDGGNNWEVKIVPALHLRSIHFADAKHGYAVGDEQLVDIDEPYEAGFWRTSNGGDTWEQFSTNKRYGFDDVHAFTDSILVVCSAHGYLARSTDRGYSWEDTLIYAMLSLDFPVPEIGYACGANGQIIQSLDSGKSWSFQRTPTLEDLYTISFINDSTGLAAGAGGVILRTSNAGRSWVQVHPSQVELPVIATMNAEGSLASISFSLPSTEKVSISLISTEGCELQRISDLEVMSAGRCERAVDVRSLPSGAYFCRVEAARYVGMGRFTITR